MKLDGKATTGLRPNKTNWANPINKPPYFGFVPLSVLALPRPSYFPVRSSVTPANIVQLPNEVCLTIPGSARSTTKSLWRIF